MLSAERTRAAYSSQRQRKLAREPQPGCALCVTPQLLFRVTVSLVFCILAVGIGPPQNLAVFGVHLHPQHRSSGVMSVHYCGCTE